MEREIFQAVHSEAQKPPPSSREHQTAVLLKGFLSKAAWQRLQILRDEVTRARECVLPASRAVRGERGRSQDEQRARLPRGTPFNISADND